MAQNRFMTTSPSPLVHLRLTLEGNSGAPMLAAMLGALLAERGALVTYDSTEVAESGAKPPADLTGLHVHLGRCIWVRNEEVATWAWLPSPPLRGREVAS